VSTVVVESPPFPTAQAAGERIVAQARSAPGVVGASLAREPYSTRLPGGAGDVFQVQVDVQRRWTSNAADAEVSFFTSVAAPEGAGRVFIQTVQSPSSDALALECSRAMADAFMQ